MTVLLHGATLIDGTGGDPRPAMTVVVEGNRVVETHPSGGPAERQDAVCLGLDGLTVLPGVIDAHAHFGLVEFAPPGTTPAAVLAAHLPQLRARAGRGLHDRARHRRDRRWGALVITILCPVCHARVPLPTRSAVRCGPPPHPI